VTAAQWTVADALGAVRNRIAAAANRAGRAPQEVSLLAVTKTVSVDRVGEAVAAGQRLFGENRIQEAQGKIRALVGEASWHMIGRLQKNKAKAAVELFDMVESVDSLELARLLSRRAEGLGKVMPILVQVKEADEETKSGVHPDEAPSLIKSICALSNLEVKGLMAIPPWPADPEDSRPYFSRLREFRDRWDGSCCPPGSLAELSMGMTVDFEVAVEEGATLVRVGSAIFGSRAAGA
jgi:pyridoxal phosphate enzyme (YggS family)